MRRADGRYTRRRAADPQGHRRNRAGSGGAKEVRVAVHQRAVAGEEAPFVRAVALSVFLGASRRPEGASRQGGFPRGRFRSRGFRVNVNATIFDGHEAEDIAKFLDFTTELGVGVSMSPGYAYERAPDQEHFLNRTKTKKLFRDVFALGKGKKWNFMHSGLFLDFLAGNQDYECTPWGMPARNIFGWQKPCYLLGEGYTKTFKELMETTDWETYGTGKYEKCADCMAHCGYEPT